MLDEDFHAEAYQHSAGDDVGGALGDGDVAPAEGDAQQGGQEGDGTDEGHDPEDGGHGVAQPQADADSEGVDAGGDAEEEAG